MKQQDAETLVLPGTDQICAWILSTLRLGKIIRIYQECLLWIEKSVPQDHSSASFDWVMPNSDPEG